MTYSTHLLRHFRFTIGQNIQHHRTRQKMPLRKLARITHINESRLDQFELGKNEIRLDEMLKIACTLKVKVKELLKYETKPLTRDFRETVKERALRDPEFKEALFNESVDCLRSGDIEIGKVLLHDYINAHR